MVADRPPRPGLTADFLPRPASRRTTEAMSEPLIALHGAGLACGVQPILVDAELAIAPGEVAVVSSAAGRGATAVVEALTGLRAATGRVALAGRDVGKLRASSLVHLRRRLGVVPQDLGLVPGATALAQVALALEVAGVGRRDRLARARAALADLEVPAERSTEALPMAERQRVAWARAFVRNPDIVLADQPTSHQDADGGERFVARLTAAVAAGAAALIFTRDPQLLAAAGRAGWRTLTWHRHQLVDPAAIAVEPIDAAALVEAEIARPIPEPELEAIPNVVPFPVARSAGHRR
jgi:ABC-type ATPase involved in cell division